MTARNSKHSSSATDPCRKWTYDGRANRKYVPLFDVENLIHEYSLHHLVKHFVTKIRTPERKEPEEEKLFTMRTIPTSCGPGHHSERHKTLAAWISVALVLLLFIHRCDAETNKICKLSRSFSFYFLFCLLQFSLHFLCFLISSSRTRSRDSALRVWAFWLVYFHNALKTESVGAFVNHTDFTRFSSHSFRALSSANSPPPFTRWLDKWCNDIFSGLLPLNETFRSFFIL